MDLVIYGAQGMALGAYEAIHTLCPARKILCFLVTRRGTNAERLSGLPVLELDLFADNLSQREKDNIEILIATPENVMEDIENNLDDRGLHWHVRLTSSRWSELMGYYYACTRDYLPLSSLPVGCHRANIHVYMAKSHNDKPLMNRYCMPEWIMPIQVGAVLCEERVADVLDCDGENISNKNKNYSELTALYWMWKNRLVQESANEVDEYYGLAHYRRILDISEDDVLRLVDNDVDVVLPYPMPYEPSIEIHHERYLKKEDWVAVLTAIRQLYPQYADMFSTVFRKKYLYNYNIMLAKKGVLLDYCNWLFPVLKLIETLSIPKGNDRSDRYIGYIGESLATLYFMANKDKLNIMHAGCSFLI